MRKITFDKLKKEQEVCKCDIHRREDERAKRDTICLGHGVGCPCYSPKKKNETVNS